MSMKDTVIKIGTNVTERYISTKFLGILTVNKF